MKKIICLVLSIFMIIALTSCGVDIEKDGTSILVSEKWKSINSDREITLNEDGTGELKYSTSSANITNWSYENTELKFSIEDWDDGTDYYLTMSLDEESGCITLTDEYGAYLFTDVYVRESEYEKACETATEDEEILNARKRTEAVDDRIKPLLNAYGIYDYTVGKVDEEGGASLNIYSEEIEDISDSNKMSLTLDLEHVSNITDPLGGDDLEVSRVRLYPSEVSESYYCWYSSFDLKIQDIEYPGLYLVHHIFDQDLIYKYYGY